MLQIRIVKYLGILTIVIGFIINLLKIDIWAALTYMGIVGIAVFLAVQNVFCLLYGSCYFSAWVATFTFSIALLGIAYFYIRFLNNSSDKLPVLAEQPIIALNPEIDKVGEFASKHANINIYQIDDHFRKLF